MIVIELWCSGTTPLLINRASEEALSGKTRSTNPGEVDDPRIVCERCLYRHQKTGQVGIPGAAIARMLREAGGSHKVKGQRKSLKYVVPAAVLVLDDLLLLYLNDRKTPLKDFEVDSRPVNIPSTKGRIMRHRPRFNEWCLKARLRINESIIDEQLVRRLAIEGVTQIGLGDYRPEKGGPFGTSDLVSWQVISEPRQKTVAQLHAAAE